MALVPVPNYQYTETPGPNTFDLLTLQQDLYTLVFAGSKSKTVIWANQSARRPARPFIELELSNMQTLNDLPEESQSDTVDPSDYSQEMTLTHREHSECQLRIRVFSDEVAGNGAAYNIAHGIRSYLSSRYVAEVEGFSYLTVVDSDAIQDISVVLDTEFEGRAIFGVRLRVAESTSETVGTIVEADISETIDEVTYPTITVGPVS